MVIGGLQKLTLIDYPGKLACTVFLSGCNFRCPWCYSRELVLPEEIEKQLKISEKELFKFLKERKGLLEGITICGGEPCINPGLPKFCKKIKKLGYLVKLDTNGSNPEMLKKLIDKNLIDYIAMDIKAPKEKYEKVTGKKVSINNIEKSINLLAESNIDLEFRTTVNPLLKKQDFVKIARWLRSVLRSVECRYYLQNFRPEKTIDPKFEKIKPYPETYLLEIQRAIAPFFDVCQAR